MVSMPLASLDCGLPSAQFPFSAKPMARHCAGDVGQRGLPMPSYLPGRGCPQQATLSGRSCWMWRQRLQTRRVLSCHQGQRSRGQCPAGLGWNSVTPLPIVSGPEPVQGSGSPLTLGHGWARWEDRLWSPHWAGTVESRLTQPQLPLWTGPGCSLPRIP